VVLARRAVHDWTTLAIAVVTTAVLFKRKIPEPLVIAAAAVVGLITFRQ
jgi:chromate transporter